MKLVPKVSVLLPLLVVLSPPVLAGPIVFSQSSIDVPGLPTQTFVFGSTSMDVVADPRAFSRKTVGTGANVSTGVGIAGGNVDGEIDPNGAGGAISESISFLWDDPVVIDSLNISFLYPSGEFGDVVNERALISVLPVIGPEILYYLTATGATTGTWTGGGLLSNVTLAQDGSPGPAGGGEWNVSGDLFGQPIIALVLRSGSASPGASKKSDFSFVALEGSNVSVPEPSALALMFAAALTVLGLRR